MNERLIITNGNVITMEAEGSRAPALAVENSRVVAEEKKLDFIQQSNQCLFQKVTHGLSACSSGAESKYDSKRGLRNLKLQ